MLGDTISLTFQMGNKHELVKVPKKSRNGEYDNKHRWTAFVKLVDKQQNSQIHKLISKVRFGLHPTFGVDYRDIKATSGKHFEMTYNGWGTFDVPITIFWSRGSGISQNLEVDHYLSFDGAGSWKTVKVQFNQKNLKALGIPKIN